MRISKFRQRSVSRNIIILTLPLLLFLLTLTSPISAQDSNSISSLRQIGKAFAGVAKKASPAVVWIKSEKKGREYPASQRDQFNGPFDPFEDDFFDFFFRHQPRNRRSPQQRPRQLSQASGFIIDPNGYILTNNHVVEGADKITVILADERKFEAELIGTDPDSEVAVVKIDANDLSYLKLADSDKIEVGEWVIAIGNPFGLSHTVTAGIVSAKGRNIGLTEYEDFIQTDAAINPGNSGGPLLNLDGEVVGINTAIISGSGGNMGIGLAIPINMAKAVYKQLIETGTVSRGALGIYIRELSPELASSLNIEETNGIVVIDVVEGSAAEKVGMKVYDVIVELDGEKIEQLNEFRNHIAMLSPGTKIKITIIRDGKRKKLDVELGQRKKDQLIANYGKIVKQLGITVENLTDDSAKRFGYQGASGVIVSQVQRNSIADLANITPGMLIMEVNRKVVSNIKEFNKAIEEAYEKNSVLLLVNNGQYNQLMVLSFPGK